jgi:predicted HAD superfamily phosphohydrolase
MSALDAFDDLPLPARRDLFRVLTADSRARADVIRQFHERGDDGMVEVLTELEADDLLRRQVIAELRAAMR